MSNSYYNLLIEVFGVLQQLKKSTFKYGSIKYVIGLLLGDPLGPWAALHPMPDGDAFTGNETPPAFLVQMLRAGHFSSSPSSIVSLGHLDETYCTFSCDSGSWCYRVIKWISNLVLDENRIPHLIIISELESDLLPSRFSHTRNSLVCWCIGLTINLISRKKICTSIGSV